MCDRGCCCRAEVERLRRERDGMRWVYEAAMEHWRAERGLELADPGDDHAMNAWTAQHDRTLHILMQRCRAENAREYSRSGK